MGVRVTQTYRVFVGNDREWGPDEVELAFEAGLVGVDLLIDGEFEVTLSDNELEDVLQALNAAKAERDRLRSED